MRIRNGLKYFLIISGLLLLAAPVPFYEFDASRSLIGQWSICLVREGENCVKGIFWIDFVITGIGLILTGFWAGKKNSPG